MAMNDVEIGNGAQGGIWLTPEGYESMKKELEMLTTVKRPEIADRIRESLQHGEFSEDNSELDEVKFEQAIVENRISELKAALGNAHVLDPASVSTDFVGVGSYVTFYDEEFDEESEIRIVSTTEADPNSEMVSNESPIGQALTGHAVGDIVEFQAPDGPKKIKIVSIRA